MNLDNANAPAFAEAHFEADKALRDPVVQRLLLAIRPALYAAGQASEVVIDHLAVALATHVAPGHGGSLASPDARTGTLAPWQERRAKDLLAANLAAGITLAELANACNLSVRHFTRAFRGSVGKSPHGWLLQLRIEKAMALLAGSGRKLADIAFECGFADQSHFTRAFQRSVGSSPGAWQRQHRRGNAGESMARLFNERPVRSG